MRNGRAPGRSALAPRGRPTEEKKGRCENRTPPTEPSPGTGQIREHRRNQFKSALGLSDRSKLEPIDDNGRNDKIVILLVLVDERASYGLGAVNSSRLIRVEREVTESPSTAKRTCVPKFSRKSGSRHHSQKPALP